MFYSRSCLCIVALLVLAFPLSAQDAPSPDIQGVRSFNEGKYKLAIRELRSALRNAPVKDDPNIWNILGTAYYETGDAKGAVEAYKKAKSLVPTNPTFRTNLAAALLRIGKFKESKSEVDDVLTSHPIFRNALYFRGILGLAEDDITVAEGNAEVLVERHPTHSTGYDLMHQVVLAKITVEKLASGPIAPVLEKLKDAKVWSEKGLVNVTDKDSRDRLKVLDDELGVLIHQIEEQTLRDTNDRQAPNAGDQTRTPLKVLSKPRPGYPEGARKAGRKGAIVLLVMLMSSGQIGITFPLNSLGHGLDEAAMAAAKKIRFVPAKVNGQPVTLVRRVEYTFDLY